MEIQNYRPYKKASLDFAYGDKNITIVLGRNDAGKTSLINAMTWCLYGKEPFREPGTEPLWNESAISEIEVDDSIDVKVEIVMEDNSNREVRFIRKQTVIKTGEFTSRKKGSSIFNIFRSDEGGDSKITSPEDYMDNNLPSSLQEYFMFTGERLTQFFNKKDSKVKEGVHILYQLDLLDGISNEARKRETTFSNKLKKINPELEKLKSSRSETVESQKNDEITLSNNEEQIKSYEHQIEVWQNEIGSSGDDAGEIQTTINDLKNKKKKLELDLKDSKKTYTSLISKSFPLIFGYPLLKNFEIWEEYEEEKDETDIISIEPRDLKRILNQKECICGNNFDENSDEYKNLNSLLELIENKTINVGKNIESYIDDNLKSSRGTLTRYPKYIKNDIVQETEKISKLKLDISSIELDIKSFERRLEQLDVDFINDRLNKISVNKDLIKSLTKQNGILENNLKDYPIIISEYDELIKEAEVQSGVKNEFQKKRDFCESIKLISRDIYNELSKSIHDTLEEIISEEYKTIHWKPDYEKIIIDNDFDVFVKKTGGRTVSVTDPSVGSRNVLALTFMSALNSLSGFVLPQIIDTPIASLDEEMRESVAKSLPRYMEGKQMILLVMDVEYRGEFKSEIKKYVGKEYNLEYSNQFGSGVTKIKEIK